MDKAECRAVLTSKYTGCRTVLLNTVDTLTNSRVARQTARARSSGDPSETPPVNFGTSARGYNGIQILR